MFCIQIVHLHCIHWTLYHDMQSILNISMKDNTWKHLHFTPPLSYNWIMLYDLRFRLIKPLKLSMWFKLCIIIMLVACPELIHNTESSFPYKYFCYCDSSFSWTSGDRNTHPRPINFILPMYWYTYIIMIFFYNYYYYCSALHVCIYEK